MNRRLAGPLCAAVVLALASSPAASHITLEKSEAQPSASYKAVLRVPHGCGGASIVAIPVTLRAR